MDSKPARVVIVASRAAAARALAARLRAEHPRVRSGGEAMLRTPALPGIYIVVFGGGRLAISGAARVAAWAADGYDVGVIGVHADGGAREREAMLAAGLDDAIAGAFDTRELVVRIRAVLRRVRWSATRGRGSTFGAFALDVGRRVVATGAIRIALTPAELAVMRELIAARGRPLSRAYLLAAAWRADAVGERAVDNIILRLRRKLPRPELLATVRGVGFRLLD